MLESFFNKVACLQPASFLHLFSKTSANDCFWRSEAIVQRCSVKKAFLEISQIHRKTLVPESLFLKKSYRPEARNFTKNEALAQVLSCDICEISKNTFFHRTPLVAAYGRCCIKKLFLKTLQYSHDESS